MLLLGVDELYPQGIAILNQPPQVLYVRGELTKADDQSVAVVGTRRPTSYGEEVTRLLVSDLVAAGFTIVSGLAFGIDAVAHRAALAAGGRTVAFLASGIDLITPTEHESLAADVIKQGALISAFSPGQYAFRGNFVARNRLVAGMSRGVLVTEGGVKSGTWLTAQFGLEQKKPVLAVPGQITSLQSQGPHHLVKAGAKLVTSGADVLEALCADTQNELDSGGVKLKPSRLSGVQSLVWDELQQRGAVTTDDLITLIGKPAGQIMAELTVMEISGWIGCLDHEWRLLR
jgi:DNA processing protein